MSHVIAYNRHSKGGKAIAKGLGFKFGDKNQHNMTDGNEVLSSSATLEPVSLAINWGCGLQKGRTAKSRSRLLSYRDIKKVINPPEVVQICSNKKTFFETMKVDGGPNIPEVTFDIEEALRWAEEGKVVLGRQEHGSSGQDIAFFNEDPAGFLNSQLWTVYKKKKAEYRFHIIAGEIILVQQKVLPSSAPDGSPIPADQVDFRIRTHRNGFIFQKKNLDIPEQCRLQALAAFNVLAKKGLDFGAVDVIYNRLEDAAYVLEVNTAPGLEGSTIDDYVQAFKKLIN